ncbi:unnamed protein product [Phytophthora fragariaefolia]|uniref:Unnamed protein product n=1 Tax=Phytophthora fragariaefolia TaxID=1490495 RepID=A0A9W7CMT3_9STRA|nr:unnamed protein product [Phytophthora fragariaefolia]
MVLTRAQARAEVAARSQAAAQEIDGNMEIDYYDDGKIDAADDGEEIGATGADRSAALVVVDKTATTSVQALGPSAQDHVAALAQQFLLQTKVMARKHAALQYQQEGQNHAHNASTETSVRRLTDQQRDIAKETHDSQLAIVSQTDEVRQNLTLMEHNMNSTLSGMMEHVQELIEAKLVDCTVDVNTVQIVQQQMEKSTDHVAATVIEHVLKLVGDKLATSQGGASLTQEAAQTIEKQVEMSREGIAAEVMDHVQQLVEGKLAAALPGASLNPEMSEIVKLQVALATESVASAIKRSVEQDLQKACGSIHDKLLRCAQDSAVETVCKTIKEGVRDLTSVDERQRHRTARSEPGGASDGEGISDSDGDSEIEKRMLETWKKSYRHAPRPVSPVQLVNSAIGPPSHFDDVSIVPVGSERYSPHVVAMGHTTPTPSAETQTEE